MLQVFIWQWKWAMEYRGWDWVPIREVTPITASGWLRVLRLSNPDEKYLAYHKKPKPLLYGKPLPADVDYLQVLARAGVSIAAQLHPTTTPPTEDSPADATPDLS